MNLAAKAPQQSSEAIRVEGLHKSFGAHEVLKGVSISAREGDVVTLIGGSGSGKSTLLRCVNFLETPSSGRIVIGGEEVRCRPDGTPADRRQIERIRQSLGMVFQSFNLWTHKTVLENLIEMPVHVLGQPKEEVIARARKLLARVGLAEKESAYPAFLSGGQQQRAAIARALCMEPRAMLFDEPTSALDPELVGEVLDSPPVRRALDTRGPLTDLTGAGPDVVRAIRPVPNQPQCRGCHGDMAKKPVNGLLVVDYAAAGLEAETRRSMGLLMLAGLAVIGSSLLASWLVLRRTVLAPLARLAAGTEALAGGRLDHRLAAQGGDEFAGLARGFNRMAERLQGAMAAAESARATVQAVIDAIPDAIRVIGPDHRILLANAAYAAHVGQPPGEVIGRPCYRSSHGRDEPCAETLVMCPLAEGRAGRLPLTCRQSHRRGGAEVHVEIAAAPVTLHIDGRDQPCVVEAIRDLDQQARLSQEQRLSELGLLAAGLAHEIYNPMSSIRLALDAAREGLAEGRMEETADRLKVIGEEVGRTLRITDSLLSLCLPPSDEAVLVEIDRVVPEALALLGFLAQQDGCRIEADIAPGLRLLGSESDLRMAVTNLALNAVHAMPAGGLVRVTGRRAGVEIVLSVSDQGIGIAPDHLRQIFLPFWTRRADGTPGRGLGLSIVHAIVTRWKGRIEVQSTLGQGSSFILSLPDPDAPPIPEDPR